MPFLHVKNIAWLLWLISICMVPSGSVRMGSGPKGLQHAIQYRRNHRERED